MKITEITRQENKVVEWTEPVLTLAAEAEQVLGYSVLKAHQSGEEQSSELQKTLEKLGIETLNKADVERYQAEMLIEQTEIKFQEWRKSPSGTFFGPTWEKLTIDKYREPIPEFVLNKAIQVKREMPDVRIYIEHLTEHPDPFLIVATKHETYECLDGESFYIEVWEEPKFEGRIR